MLRLGWLMRQAASYAPATHAGLRAIVVAAEVQLAWVVLVGNATAGLLDRARGGGRLEGGELQAVGRAAGDEGVRHA